MTRTIFLALFMLAFSAAVSLAAEEGALAAEVKAEEKAAEAPAQEEVKEAPKEEKKEEAKETAPEKVELPPEARAHQEAAEKVFADIKEIAGSLKPEEQKHFFLLYSNYNIIGTVKMVQGDVDNAVEGCGKENPDLKAGMDARLKEWHGAIDPVIEEAEANVDNMVLAQEYTKPAQIQKVFKGLDKTRALAAKQVEKIPVTTKDACEYLQEKMSDTQENFIRLLRSTLVSVPQVATQPAEEKAEEKTEEKPAESAEPSAAPKE
ncbi:MAG: hypothetical protein DYH13_05765 [Alphaproteobacteria bacterium PRO2]|nr:hypothetical protein [Alphaproteobacteria bacterium PRO2]